ncbi:hypothetical protein FQN57_001304 [Myotisia sp. PD_48]|nr:hypothetical protein FQN57_001304 [Myotisia sp. PD_48]
MSICAESKSRKLWSEKEDHILRSQVARQGIRKQEKEYCRKRWIKLDSPVKKGPWSNDEDQRLHKGVLLHSNVWTEVAQVVGTRHADQCAKRWLHFLNPTLNHSEWTEQEDRCLLAEVEKGGRNWRKIVDAYLPDRSATDAKNRYSILQRNLKIQDGQCTITGVDRHRFSRRRRNSSVFENLSPGSECSPRSPNFMEEYYLSSSGRTNEPILLIGNVQDVPSMIRGQTQQAECYPLQSSSTVHQSSLNCGQQEIDQDSGISTHLFGDLLMDTENRLCTGMEDQIFGNPQNWSRENGIKSLLDPGIASSSTGDYPEIQQEASTSGFLCENSTIIDVNGPKYQANENLAATTLVGQVGDITPLASSSSRGVEDPGLVRSRKSTMVLQNMQPDQVGQVLELLFASNSTVNVNIISHNYEEMLP